MCVCVRLCIYVCVCACVCVGAYVWCACELVLVRRCMCGGGRRYARSAASTLLPSPPSPLTTLSPFRSFSFSLALALALALSVSPFLLLSRSSPLSHSRVAVCCSVLQRVVACCSVLQYLAVYTRTRKGKCESAWLLRLKIAELTKFLKSQVCSHVL